MRGEPSASLSCTGRNPYLPHRQPGSGLLRPRVRRPDEARARARAEHLAAWPDAVGRGDRLRSTRSRRRWRRRWQARSAGWRPASRPMPMSRSGADALAAHARLVRHVRRPPSARRSGRRARRRGAHQADEQRRRHRRRPRPARRARRRRARPAARPAGRELRAARRSAGPPWTWRANWSGSTRTPTACSTAAEYLDRARHRVHQAGESGPLHQTASATSRSRLSRAAGPWR